MSKIDFDQNNEEYFDVLREIGNVGASNASAALAQLLGRRVEVHVPKVKLLDFHNIGKAIGGEERGADLLHCFGNTHRFVSKVSHLRLLYFVFSDLSMISERFFHFFTGAEQKTVRF